MGPRFVILVCRAIDNPAPFVVFQGLKSLEQKTFRVWPGSRYDEARGRERELKIQVVDEVDKACASHINAKLSSLTPSIISCHGQVDFECG